jgi:hypothetical protein
MRGFGRLGGTAEEGRAVVQEEGDNSSVIEVHPPEEPLHGWRDFLIHLATITIGLLIALSLE